MKFKHILSVLIIAILIITAGWLFLVIRNNEIPGPGFEIIFPENNQVLSGIVNLYAQTDLNITDEVNWTRTDYYIDDEFLNWVSPGVDGHFFTILNTSVYSNGEHILKVVCYWNGEHDPEFKSNIISSNVVTVIFDN